MRAVDFFPTSAQVDADERRHEVLVDGIAQCDAQIADVNARLAALEEAKAAGLVPETDRDQCRCGNACPACGNCLTMSVGCGWHRCDGNGFVYGGDAQAEAIAETERKARLKRARRGW